jgi:3,2-trans-enoyl-CoA isomerase
MIKIEKRDQYEILVLNRGKGNPINNEMVTAIRENLARIKNDPETRGIIWIGNTPGYFSVGLDLKELYYYDETQIQVFWDNWDAMVMELIKFPKPMIAAINGYSPAGGCVLAVTCDYRMMSEGEKFVIGLNEAAVGIVVPEYIYQIYAFWIGSRQAYHNLLRGRLLSVQEAHDCKLVDEVHPMETLLPAAEKEMQRILRVPDNILINSKRHMRAAMVDRLEQVPKPDPKVKLAAWFDPKSRAMMKMIVDQLSK